MRRKEKKNLKNSPIVNVQEILRAQDEVLQERVGKGTQTESATRDISGRNLQLAETTTRDISGRHRAPLVRRRNGESQTGTCTDSGETLFLFYYYFLNIKMD